MKGHNVKKRSDDPFATKAWEKTVGQLERLARGIDLEDSDNPLIKLSRAEKQAIAESTTPAIYLSRAYGVSVSYINVIRRRAR